MAKRGPYSSEVASTGTSASQVGQLPVRVIFSGKSPERADLVAEGVCTVQLHGPDSSASKLFNKPDLRDRASSNSTLRRTPFATVVELDSDDMALLVGSFDVILDDDDVVQERIDLDVAYRSPRDDINFTPMNDVQDLVSNDGFKAIIDKVNHLAGNFPADSTQEKAAFIAKRVCEHSRNSIEQLRILRHGIELTLADAASGSIYSRGASSMVSDLVHLHVAFGRAKEAAQHDIRAGFHVWVTDDDFYHHYRALMDPTLVHRPGVEAGEGRTWERTHDAAIRNCKDLVQIAADDLRAIEGTLTSASSVAAAKQSDAQAQFNLFAAVISVGIGLPGLLASIYSAKLLVPLHGVSNVLPFLPMAFSLLIAGAFGWKALPSGSEAQQRGWRMAIVLMLVLILCAMVSIAILANVT